MKKILTGTLVILSVTIVIAQGSLKISAAQDLMAKSQVEAATGMLQAKQLGATLTAMPTYTGGLVRSIAMDPDNPQHAFVVGASNAATAGVYRTTDAGATWSNITGNLMALNPGLLRSIKYVQSLPAETVVVGADAGMYVASGPSFTNWSLLGVGLLKAPVSQSQHAKRDDILLARTLGRSGPTPYQVSTSPWTWEGSVVRLTDSWNTVGIGTTAPAGQLHVDVGGDGDGNFVVRRSGPGKVNVGIGTKNPNNRLTIGDKDVLTTANYIELNSSYWSGILFPKKKGGARILYDNLPNIMRFLVVPDDGSSPSKGMTITETGNVGIGTPVPAGRLHVDVDGDGDGDFVVRDSGPGKGNVGIGTKVPDNRLTVGDKVALSTENYLELNASTLSGILFHGRGKGAGINYNYPQETMRFETSPGDGSGPFERMTITGIGNVGIGTRIVEGKLHVDIDGDGDGDFVVKDVGPRKGNVGIGTKNPDYRLTIGDKAVLSSNNYVELNASNSTGILFHGRGKGAGIAYNHAQNYMRFETSPGDGSGPTERMGITGDGIFLLTPKNLGPAHPALRGSQFAIAWNKSGGRGETDFYQHGGAGWRAGYDFYSQRNQQDIRLLARLTDIGNLKLRGSVGSLSDARDKVKVRPVVDSVQKVLRLRGVYFNWKADEGRDNDTHIGMIAQEVRKVVPEVVMGGTNNHGEEEPYYLNYDGLIPLLIEAVKEQQRTIDSLSKRVSDLEKQLKRQPLAQAKTQRP